MKNTKWQTFKGNTRRSKYFDNLVFGIGKNITVNWAIAAWF